MLSIIIPTYNRAQILKKCLERLLTQEDVLFEVIVIDDGSTDDTEKVLKSMHEKFTEKNLNLIALHQPNSRQAVARNKGLEKATGELILFIDDDIHITPGFLKAHLNAHEAHPNKNVAVLGQNVWDPTLPTNDYMKFLDDSGWQFGFKFLKPGFIHKKEPYKYFYSSNLSLKKTLLESERFSEVFKEYGWEDTELAYRLTKNHNLKIFYEPSALAHHHSHFSPDCLPKKMQTIGKSARTIQKLHPELKIIPKGKKRLILELIHLLKPSKIARFFSRHWYYKLRSWEEFIKGVKSH